MDYSYRPRSRTPPRHGDGYRPSQRYDSSYASRDSRPRSPRRDYPSDSRYDDSSRPRRGSPGRRSPGPSRRSSPPRSSYRERSRSPRRDDHSRSWRRRSPSPRSSRDGRQGEPSSSSRRSSPRPYPRHDNYAHDDYRGSSYRSPRPRSPSRRDSDHRSPYNDTERAPQGSDEQMSGGSRNADPRAPSAPREHRDFASPPTGPSRGGFTSSGRGSYRGRGSGRDYPSRDPAAPQRSGSWGGPPRDPYGPRRESSGYGRFGGGNTTSMTTPRTQRFNTALQDLPKPKEGGEKLPSLHDTTKADRLEEEAARLRKLIDDKETKKRQGLREWERLERETNNSALRTELAEEHLKSMNGEESMSTAAF